MRRTLYLILLLTLSAANVFPQTSKTIRDLEKQQKELQRQINEQESLLKSAKKDVKSQMSNLALITGQIEERKKYITSIESDMKTVDREIRKTENELKSLERELSEARSRYHKSVTYMRRNQGIHEKLMFIFAADNLNQMYRRMRYVQQYADFQKKQGEKVQKKQEEVNTKRNELLATRKAKEKLATEARKASQKLEAQEKDKKNLVNSLKKKQKGIQNELNKQKRDAEKLNKQIDRLIAIEVEKSRKRAKEEAERLAKSDKSSGGGSGAKKMEAYKVDSEDRRLSSVFENNKGKLPIPVTGAYVIVGHYGQYNVQGLKNVRLDNKGVDIKGKSGAMARCIFDGEVSAIFQYNGLSNVLVRHGSYISVYCNLSSVSVKKGSKLKTRDTIGKIHTDTDGNAILHFQLRKETTKLNPELWLTK